MEGLKLILFYYQISASWAEQKVPYAGATKNIKKGVFIQGKINILGFAPTVEILLNDKVRIRKR